MALENIVGGDRGRRRWMIAFGFGLVHGFGFSFALRETLQFAGSHLLTSLLVVQHRRGAGTAAGAACCSFPRWTLLFRFVVAERMGTIILSALVAHTGWHWMTERWERLRQFNFEWPVLNAALLAMVTRWAALILFLLGAFWVASQLRARAGSVTTGSSEQSDRRRVRRPAWFS